MRVEADSDGQRIDNYLKKCLSGVPVGHVYRIIRTGQVRVNGKRIKASGRVAAGDDLRLPPMYDMQADNVAVPESVVQTLETSIIFEDEELVVLNKPGGLAVHGGSGLAFGIIEALRQSRDDRRLELVHRLDRETSGCLLIGKSLVATRKYQDIFRQRRVVKIYRALVHGRWQADEQKVSNHLSSNREISGERMVVADDGGKFAESFFSTKSFLQPPRWEFALRPGALIRYGCMPDPVDTLWSVIPNTATRRPTSSFARTVLSVCFFMLNAWNWKMGTSLKCNRMRAGADRYRFLLTLVEKPNCDQAIIRLNWKMPENVCMDT